jgi:putative protease
LTKWSSELNRIATRPYTTGFMTGATYDLQDQKKESVPVRYDFCGMVKGYDETKKMLIVEQRQNFGPGDNLEVMIPGGQALSICLTEMYDEEYKIMDRARHARQTVLLPFARPLPEYSILRRLTTQ